MAWLPQQIRFYLSFAFVNTISLYVYKRINVYQFKRLYHSLGYYNKQNHIKIYICYLKGSYDVISCFPLSLECYTLFVHTVYKIRKDTKIEVSNPKRYSF